MLGWVKLLGWVMLGWVGLGWVGGVGGVGSVWLGWFQGWVELYQAGLGLVRLAIVSVQV